MSSHHQRSDASWIWRIVEPFNAQKREYALDEKDAFPTSAHILSTCHRATARLGHKGLFESLDLSPKKNEQVKPDLGC